MRNVMTDTFSDFLFSGQRFHQVTALYLPRTNFPYGGDVDGAPRRPPFDGMVFCGRPGDGSTCLDRDGLHLQPGDAGLTALRWPYDPFLAASDPRAGLFPYEAIGRPASRPGSSLQPRCARFPLRSLSPPLAWLAARSACASSEPSIPALRFRCPTVVRCYFFIPL